MRTVEKKVKIPTPTSDRADAVIGDPEQAVQIALLEAQCLRLAAGVNGSTFEEGNRARERGLSPAGKK